MNSCACRVTDLCVSFHGNEVLHHVSLEAPSRGITVLFGRSGSGKTTLLRALNRLNETIPGCRTSGSVLLKLQPGDAPLTDIYAWKEPVSSLRRRVGMVFQTPNPFPVSIADNLALPLREVAGVARAEVADRSEQALRRVGLWEEICDRLSLAASRLSGGQQQRLCFARTLALEPEMLLLDEPTASLDVNALQRIEDLLLELAETLPLIVVSHNPAQSVRLASRIVLIHGGKNGDVFVRGGVDATTLASLLDAEIPGEGAADR